MGMKERMIAKAIAKTDVGKAFRDDPKGTYFTVIGNLLTGMKNRGFDKDLKKYLKENHGWIYE